MALRLIDANALKERMNSDFWSNVADLVDALEIIDSAPTVETTDEIPLSETNYAIAQADYEKGINVTNYTDKRNELVNREDVKNALTRELCKLLDMDKSLSARATLAKVIETVDSVPKC